MKTIAEVASLYANNGIRVFPCDPKTKKPLTKNGFKDATCDTTKVLAWWNRTPDALIGGVCDNHFTVIDVDLKHGSTAFDSYLAIKPHMTTNVVVNTRSGGIHFYYKSDSKISRMINVIPSIDVLGFGGYTILPDGYDYWQRGSIEWFIGELSSLPALPDAMLSIINGDLTPEAVERTRPARTRRSGEVSDQDEQEALRQEALKDRDDVLSTSIYDRSAVVPSGHVDFVLGQVVTPNTLNSEVTMGWFHTRQVQEHLYSFMRMPYSGFRDKTPSFKSMIPNHSDSSPSMAARWNKTGTHIIVRDFSNHYGDGAVDYNLVRLYASQQKKTRVPDLSPPEFFVWFIQMMVRSNAIVVEFPKINVDGLKLSKAEYAVYEGVVELFTYKNLLAGFDQQTVFSTKFAEAWTGIYPRAINSCKSKLIQAGILKIAGTHGSGFFSTPIYELNLSPAMREDVATSMRRTIVNGASSRSPSALNVLNK